MASALDTRDRTPASLVSVDQKDDCHTDCFKEIPAVVGVLGLITTGDEIKHAFVS